MDQSLHPATKYWALIVCLLTAVMTGWLFFRPYPRPSPWLVEPRLSQLEKPYLSVEAAYHTDGGSISILITDATGRRELFGIPHRMDRNENYQQVYVGGMHRDSPGAIPVEHSLATKRELVCVLAAHRSDPRAAHVLAILSGRLSDQARNKYNAWRGNLNNP